MSHYLILLLGDYKILKELQCVPGTSLLPYFTSQMKATAMVFIYEVRKNIILFVLNTDGPWRDARFLRYQISKNNMINFLRKLICILSNILQTVLLITWDPCIPQRLFCIQNKWRYILSNLIQRPLM